MNWMAKRLKAKIQNSIDTLVNRKKQEVEEAQSKFENLKADLEKLENSQKEIFGLDHMKKDVDRLKNDIKKELMDKEAGEIVNIVEQGADKSGVMRKYDIPETITSTRAYKEKFLGMMVDEIKKINNL